MEEREEREEGKGKRSATTMARMLDDRKESERQNGNDHSPNAHLVWNKRVIQANMYAAAFPFPFAFALSQAPDPSKACVS